MTYLVLTELFLMTRALDVAHNVVLSAMSRHIGSKVSGLSTFIVER